MCSLSLPLPTPHQAGEVILLLPLPPFPRFLFITLDMCWKMGFGIQTHASWVSPPWKASSSVRCSHHLQQQMVLMPSMKAP